MQNSLYFHSQAYYVVPESFGNTCALFSIGFYVNKKVWKEKYYEMNSFVVVISNRCFFLQRFC